MKSSHDDIVRGEARQKQRKVTHKALIKDKCDFAILFRQSDQKFYRESLSNAADRSGLHF